MTQGRAWSRRPWLPRKAKSPQAPTLHHQSHGSVAAEDLPGRNWRENLMAWKIDRGLPKKGQSREGGQAGWGRAETSGVLLPSQQP